jgi:hypothetical protein
LYAQWQGQVWDGEIKYPDSFNIQDKYNDMNMLKLAKDAGPRSDIVHKVIEEEMLRILVDEDDYEEYKNLVDVSVPQETAAATAPIAAPTSQEVPQQERTYPDGEVIPADLPPLYQDAGNQDVPPGQNCGNCEYYMNGLCGKFNNAPVRTTYWCAKWEPIEDADITQ